MTRYVCCDDDEDDDLAGGCEDSQEALTFQSQSKRCVTDPVPVPVLYHSLSVGRVSLEHTGFILKVYHRQWRMRSRRLGGAERVNSRTSTTHTVPRVE